MLFFFNAIYIQCVKYIGQCNHSKTPGFSLTQQPGDFKPEIGFGPAAASTQSNSDTQKLLEAATPREEWRICDPPNLAEL